MVSEIGSNFILNTATLASNSNGESFGIVGKSIAESDKYFEAKMEEYNRSLRSKESRFTPEFVNSFDRCWDVVDCVEDSGSILKLNYIACAILLNCKLIPIINEYVNLIICFRGKFKELESNKYIGSIFGDCFWTYNFNDTKSIDALALVFLFKSKNICQATIEDVDRLKQLQLSDDIEVQGISKCLMLANEYYISAAKLYENVNVINALFILNSFFNANRNGRKIQGFYSDTSVSIINRLNIYIHGFLGRSVSKTLKIDETIAYPTTDDLHLLKLDVERWEVESQNLKHKFVEIYDLMKEKRDTSKLDKIWYTKKYLNHTLDSIQMPMGGRVPRMIEFYESCKKAPEQPPESSSSSAIQEKIKGASKKKGVKQKKTGKGKGTEPKGKSKKLKVVYIEREESNGCLSQPLVEEQSKVVAVAASVPCIAQPVFERVASVQLNYAKRVLEWFKDEPSYFNEGTYSVLSPQQRRLQHLFHGFTRVVDMFLEGYSIKGTWFNEKRNHQDKMYCIPSEIHVRNRRIRGLLIYSLGRDSCFYHRHFSVKSKEEFIKYADSSYFKANDPLLKDTTVIDEGVFDELRDFDSSRGEELFVNPLNQLVTIKDIRHNARLYLYKPAAN